MHNACLLSTKNVNDLKYYNKFYEPFKIIFS